MKPDSVIPIRFTLNGEIMNLEVDAGETALSVLRKRLLLKGTKEGCGMGECGACTILVDGKSVNACLMAAPQLGGRTVMTVEGLGNTEALHPLQKAFLEHHGVQCGFCTPGLLMSAQALIGKRHNPRKGRWWRQYPEICAGVRDISRLSMPSKKVPRRPAGRVRPLIQPAYARPETLGEALHFLKHHGADTRPLAGGTDVMVDLRSGKLEIPYLLDISRLPDLQGIFLTPEGLSIGRRRDHQ